MHVAVVGAGPAGCAAAIALAARCQVTLISDGRHGVGEQLSPACAPLLGRLGMLPLGQLDCVGINGLWNGQTIAQDYLFHPLGMGWLLDRVTFGEALRARAVEAGARLLEGRFVGIRPGWLLELESGTLRADFVVDATGRRGAVARRLGVPRRRLMAQTAVMGFLESERDDPDQTLSIESVQAEWGYTCRTGPRSRVATWLSPGRPRPADWWANLSRTRLLRDRLRGYTLESELRSVPADVSRLETAAGERWAAIGDAARSHDPLSGRGIYCSLLEGLEVGRRLGLRA